MNWEDIWMQVSVIALLTMLISLIGIIITELGSSHKIRDMLLNVKEYLSKEHDSVKCEIKNDIMQASKTIDSLNAAFGSFAKENAVAEEIKKRRYKNLKNTQKEVIDSIEKLSEFSNLLLEQQETIKELEKEIDILKHERDLALQSKSKSRYKNNDQTIEL